MKCSALYGNLDMSRPRTNPCTNGVRHGHGGMGGATCGRTRDVYVVYSTVRVARQRMGNIMCTWALSRIA